MTNSSSSYYFAQKHKWLDKIIPIKRKWTYKECAILIKNYKFFVNWKNSHYSSFAYAKKMNWFPKLKKMMGVKETKPLGYWNYERCKEQALLFTYMNEWMKKSPGSYKCARKNGWLKELSPHFVSPVRTKWTKDDCIEDAKRFKKPSHWHHNSQCSYAAARKNGWLPECTKHMVKTQEQDQRERREVIKLVKMIKTKIKPNNIEIEKMVGFLNFPDLTITINDKILLIEVKHDESYWRKSKLVNQISKYTIAGKKEHKRKFHSIHLCSTKGRYGISFEEMIKTLAKIKKEIIYGLS
jgi:hypothetical protein